MPNWCDNSITIQGPVETISQLWKKAQEAEGLLEAMVTMPKRLRNTRAPQDSQNWYNWSVENWGTKWDVSLEGLEFNDNGDGTASIEGWFDSAWSPPISAYDAFLENTEDCTIFASYYEPGLDYAGFYTDGVDELCDNLSVQYGLSEDKRSELYRRLDEEYNLSERFAEWEEENEI